MAMTLKQFKADPKKAMLELGDTIYCKKPYVILDGGVVLSAGDADHFAGGIFGTAGYYDHCEFKLRGYDLHMNDNTKCEEQRILNLMPTGALVASCSCGYNHLYLLRGKVLAMQG